MHFPDSVVTREDKGNVLTHFRPLNAFDIFAGDLIVIARVGLLEESRLRYGCQLVTSYKASWHVSHRRPCDAEFTDPQVRSHIRNPPRHCCLQNGLLKKLLLLNEMLTAKYRTNFPISAFVFFNNSRQLISPGVARRCPPTVNPSGMLESSPVAALVSTWSSGLL
jgi:hypothetical protein